MILLTACQVHIAFAWGKWSQLVRVQTPMEEYEHTSHEIVTVAHSQVAEVSSSRIPHFSCIVELFE